MCQSKTQGGQRCYANLLPVYTHALRTEAGLVLALDRADRNGKPISANVMDAAVASWQRLTELRLAMAGTTQGFDHLNDEAGQVEVRARRRKDTAKSDSDLRDAAQIRVLAEAGRGLASRDPEVRQAAQMLAEEAPHWEDRPYQRLWLENLRALSAPVTTVTREPGAQAFPGGGASA